MAKLTGNEILKEVEAGHIIIDPFEKSHLNPNSYNLRLGNRLLTYKPVSSRPDFNQDMEDRILSLPRAVNRQPGFNEVILDSHADNPTEEHIIPESGFLLQPGILYLGTTVEKTWTDRYVPELGGRSSTGRLSMMVHITAGFGDVGFDGRWTLEIVVFHNLIVYPNDEILQVHFTTTKGDLGYQYNGRYNHQEDVTASRFYMPKTGIFAEKEKSEEMKLEPLPDEIDLRYEAEDSPYGSEGGMMIRALRKDYTNMKCIAANLVFEDETGREFYQTFRVVDNESKKK